MTEKKLNKVVNELINMYIISHKSNKWYIALSRFYVNMIRDLPNKDYEHIHEAFLTEN